MIIRIHKHEIRFIQIQLKRNSLVFVVVVIVIVRKCLIKHIFVEYILIINDLKFSCLIFVCMN